MTIAGFPCPDCDFCGKTKGALSNHLRVHGVGDLRTQISNLSKGEGGLQTQPKLLVLTTSDILQYVMGSRLLDAISTDTWRSHI